MKTLRASQKGVKYGVWLEPDTVETIKDTVTILTDLIGEEPSQAVIVRRAIRFYLDYIAHDLKGQRAIENEIDGLYEAAGRIRPRVRRRVRRD